MGFRSYRKEDSAPKSNPLATKAANSAKSALRNRSGNSIESMIVRTNETYQTQGVAVIRKLHPPATVKHRVGAVPWIGSADADYLGSIAPNGQSIAFDVKGVTGQASFGPPSDHKDRMRQLRQASYLHAIRRTGGLAFFLCYDTRIERGWLVFDLDAVIAGQSIPLRTIERAQRTLHIAQPVSTRLHDLHPFVTPGSLEAIARGAPSFDYLTVLLRSQGLA